ncbi:MAG: monovalent cation/H+ antiporter complex subunit F [Bacteroidetes bacterium]|nr:monovalent cation/H+ antiporter complex subunit F [Bacteroidota bacterium]
MTTLELFLDGAAVLLALAVVLTFIRIVRGPSLADRVVGFELLSAAAIGIIAIASVRFHDAVFIDVALLLSLLAFVSTVAFARFLDRRDEA